MRLSFLILLLLLTNTVNAQSYMRVPLVRVYDGDTFESRLNRMPEPLNKVFVRVKGIDTPEMPAKSYKETGKLGRAKCVKEAELALQAKEYVTELLAGKTRVYIYNYKWGKYGGRIVADVYLGDGAWLSDKMIEAGYAVKYDGTGPKKDWCQ